MRVRPELYLVLGMLVLDGWTDLKKREISLSVTVLFWAAGVVLSFLQVIDGMGIPAALAAGGAAVLVSLMPGELIGMGDGLVLMTLCLYLNGEEMLAVLSSASVLCMAFGLILLLLMRKPWIRIPFIPFLLAGALVLFFAERGRMP